MNPSSKNPHNKPRRNLLPIALFLVAGATLLVLMGSATGAETGAVDGDVVFTDAKAQSDEFIGYYHSIALDDEQEAIKRAALEPMPAPCCSDNSAYTCCCPCNLSKTIWGLSAYLITEQGADAETVSAKVTEWIEYVNPDGFSGNVCTSAGGCPRPFAKNGCGGMRGAVTW